MNSLRKIAAVWRRELSTSAASPVAWVFLVIFLELSAFLAFLASGLYSYEQADLTPFFFWLPWLFLLICPALGMSVWSEERRTGTFELTVSFPVTLTEMVIGKFLAGLTLLGIALLLTVSIPVAGFYLGEPDAGATLCGYFGAFLLGGMTLAAANFCSALTKSQTASFLLALVICCVLMVAGLPAVVDAGELYLPDSVLNALEYIAFLPHYQTFLRGFLSTSDLFYYLSMTIFFLTLAVLSLERNTRVSVPFFASGSMKDPASRKGNLAFLLKLLCCCVILLCTNYGCSVFRYTVDMSSDGAYSLSPESRKFAKRLKQHATIRFYVSSSSIQLPPEFKQYAQRVIWLLKSFCEASEGKLTLQVLNPDPDSGDELAAHLEGIKPMQVNTGERVYMGLSVSCADRCLAIPFLSLSQENLLEYQLVRTVLNTVSQEKPKIGVMSAFPVMGTPADSHQFRQVQKGKVIHNQPWYVIAELAADHHLVELSLDVQEIPQDLSALLIIHPAGITQRTLYAIDQYLMRGGRAAIFLDPHSLYASLKMRQDFSYSEKLSSDESMKKLLDHWGILPSSKMMTADLIHAHRAVTPEKMSTNPLALELKKDAFSKESLLTSNLNTLSMWFTRPLEWKSTPEIHVAELVRTSPESQLVSAYTADRPELVLRHFKSSGERYPLGVLLSGKFTSAFRQPPVVSKQKHLTESTGDPCVVIFGDSDMLFNDLCIRHLRDAYGQITFLRRSDNAALLQGIMEQLSGEGGVLAKIRGRIPMSRPLTKYNELRAKAELTYKNRIGELEQSLRISAMKAKRIQEQFLAAGGKTVLTAEQRRELENYTYQSAKLRTELKEIRGKLRADIKQIDTRLRFWNMLVVPLIVAAAGVAWSLFRFSKRRHQS